MTLPGVFFLGGTSKKTRLDVTSKTLRSCLRFFFVCFVSFVRLFVFYTA